MYDCGSRKELYSKDTIFKVCEYCEGLIDEDGDSVEDYCIYSPICCDKCHYQPCNGSC